MSMGSRGGIVNMVSEEDQLLQLKKIKDSLRFQEYKINKLIKKDPLSKNRIYDSFQEIYHILVELKRRLE